MVEAKVSDAVARLHPCGLERIGKLRDTLRHFGVAVLAAFELDGHVIRTHLRAALWPGANSKIHRRTPSSDDQR